MALLALPPALALIKSATDAWQTVPALASAIRADRYGTVNRLIPPLAHAIRNVHADLARLQMFGIVPGIAAPLSQADRASAGAAAALGDLTPILIPAERLWSAWNRMGAAVLPPRTLRAVAVGLGRAGGPAWQAGTALVGLSRYLPQGGDRHLLATWGRRLRTAGGLARAAPALGGALGDAGLRRYLVLFEDSGELRGGGGFIAGYGYLTIRDGRFRLEGIGPIARLSRRSTTVLRAPPMLVRFFGQHRLSLMNANLAPWSAEDSRTVLRLYRGVPGHPAVAGVIWVDTWAADRFLDAFGPVTLDPSGRRVAVDGRDNVAMERLAYDDGQAGTRAVLQGIASKLQAMLSRPAGNRAAFAAVAAWALGREDLYAYSENRTVEGILRRIGAGGESVPGPRTDYLAVVDNNLGAHKDNLFLRQAVAVSRAGPGHRTETIRLRWRLPHRADGWLVVPYRGWTTVYLPLGTRLLSAAPPGGERERLIRSVGGPARFGFALHVPAEADRSAPAVHVTLRVRLPPSVASDRRLTVLLEPGQRGQLLCIGRGPWRWQTRTRTFRWPPLEVLDHQLVGASGGIGKR